MPELSTNTKPGSNKCCRIREEATFTGVITLEKVRPAHLIIIFVFALSTFSILLWPSQSSRVQYWQDRLFSPGPVSLAHQRDIQGNVIACQGCHKPGKAITNGICRGCHDRKYFEQKQPRLADAHEVFYQKDHCLRCHGEHRGAYMRLKMPGFTAQAHRDLPVNTDKCVNCHRLDGKQVHPTLINEDCGACHKDYRWASEFKHKEFLAQAANAEKMLDLCRRCHNRGHHYTIGPQARANCIICHEFWGWRHKHRPIPFPEEFFKYPEGS